MHYKMQELNSLQQKFPIMKNPGETETVKNSTPGDFRLDFLAGINVFKIYLLEYISWLQCSTMLLQ